MLAASSHMDVTLATCNSIHCTGAHNSAMNGFVRVDIDWTALPNSTCVAQPPEVKAEPMPFLVTREIALIRS